MPKKVNQDLQKPQYAGFTFKVVAKSDSNVEVDLSGIPINRVELVRQSKKAEYNNYAFCVGGSSHIGQDAFTSALNLKFWDGLDRKHDIVFPGAILSVSGGGIHDSEKFVQFATQVSEGVGYKGQIFQLVLGTNDASNGLLDQDFVFAKYKELCLALLRIPKLFLMPTSLLPRSFNPKQPKRNPNMYPTTETIRSVCADLRLDPKFLDRVKFVNVHENIGNVVSNELDIEVLVLREGMLEEDNVHLTSQANDILADNLLKAINLFPNEILNAPTKKPKKKLM